MTKTHILIRSLALSVLLIITSPAYAADPVDQVLVQYFKKLYSGSSPKCTVDPAVQTKILREIEPKCLTRDSSNSYISGVKPTCTEESVKASVDGQVGALCQNSAFVADQAKVAKQQEVAQQAAAAAKKQAAGGGGGGSNSANTLQAVAQGLQLYSEIAPSLTTSKETAAKEAAAKATASKEGYVLGKGEKLPDQKLKEIPKIGTATIYGNAQGSAVDGAVDKANVEIRKVNAAVDERDKAAASTPKVDPAKDSPIAKGELSTAEQSAETAKVLPEATEAAKDLPTAAQTEGTEAVKPETPTGTDPALEARHAKSKAEDQALIGKIDAFRTKLNAAIKMIGPEAMADCTQNDATRAKNYGTTTDNPVMEGECKAGTPQKVLSCIDTNFAQVEKDRPKLQEDKVSCSDTSAQAEKLCSMVRSEKAQTVQKLMSVGATILSKVTAASEACGTTSNLSKVAQGGMMLAQGACTAMKFRCDFSCNSAEKTIASMQKSVAAALKCGASKIEPAKMSGQNVDRDLAELEKMLAQELVPEKSVPTAIVQCKEHKADIALMGAAALGFLSAFQDAQECKKQLASGDSVNANGKSTSSLAGPQMTTAEYCSTPANATSLTCKCTSNPSAEGCMGSLAKSGVNIGKINSGNGPSAFASAGQNGLGSIDSLSNSPSIAEELAPGANLSDAAREALGISGAADASAAAGGTGTGGSSPEAAKKAKSEEEKEKSKYGFFSSLGNMMSGGRAPSAAANAAIRKFEQEQAIKRKLASDQVRAEVTAASGKSNFDKIRSRYQQNASSFEQ